MYSSFLGQGGDAAVAPITVEAVEALDPDGRVVPEIRPHAAARLAGGRGGRRGEPGRGDGECRGGKLLVTKTSVLN